MCLQCVNADKSPAERQRAKEEDGCTGRIAWKEIYKEIVDEFLHTGQTAFRLVKEGILDCPETTMMIPASNGSSSMQLQVSFV